MQIGTFEESTGHFRKLMKRNWHCAILGGASIILATLCVVSAIAEGNANTFDRAFALHSILAWAWMIDTIAVIFLSRFTWYYLLLVILAPLAFAPIPTWMFIIFRVFNVPFAP